MYERDFKRLTVKEKQISEKYLKHLNEIGWKYMLNDFVDSFLHVYGNLPAVAFNLSLFPNIRIVLEFLDGNLENSQPELILENFKLLLNERRIRERDILNFINKNYGYFIPASIAIDYSNWGHHELYVFPEFPLGTNFIADYLIVGKNSDGYHLMFVELETAYDSISNKNGEFGSSIRKGLSQISEWQHWLEKNYSHLKPIFEKHKSDFSVIPDELFEYDSTRISFAIVCGRRIDFNPKTRLLRRKELQNNRTIILHYDNIIELSERMVRYRSLGGSGYLTREGATAEYTGKE